jgi:hypothetical protein
MAEAIGVLAYGSLVDDPGWEIADATTATLQSLVTPFCVEYARSSQQRGGAPTLVPVVRGGAAVAAIVYQLGVGEIEAADMLYRREINQVGSTKRYPGPRPSSSNAIHIGRISGMAGCDFVLYACLSANIDDPISPERLAELAVSSVCQTSPGRDGISYLMNAKANGIITPLTPKYEEEILRLTRAGGLEDALARLVGDGRQAK